MFINNRDTMNKFYENFSQDLMKCYNDYFAALGKMAETNNPDTVINQENNYIYPASGHDICSHTNRKNIAKNEFQSLIKLDGRLDFTKLKRSVRLSIDAEPVFGSRLVEADPPYWNRIKNIDDSNFCSIEENDNYDEAAVRFLKSPLDMENDTNVKVKIIRTHQFDILGVKINQACCDGTGVKEYIQLLSHIYTCIDKENGTFMPNSHRCKKEEGYSLLKDIDSSRIQLKWNPQLDTTRKAWEFPWLQKGNDSVNLVLCRLPKGGLETISRYGELRGATINDIILTAYYRVLFSASKPVYGVPMDISSTVDLRRYLPADKSQAIRNLSGGLVTRIPRIVNENFEGTLSRVVNSNKKISDSSKGLNRANDEKAEGQSSITYFVDYFESISPPASEKSPPENQTSALNKCFPALHGLVSISEDSIRFGKNGVADIYLVPPVACVPGLLLLPSAYNGILTIAAGYCRDSIAQNDMSDFLKMIKNELMRGCGCN